MTTMQIILAVLALLLGSSVVGTLVTRLLPERKSRGDEMSKLRTDLADVRTDLRRLSNYVHEVRGDVVALGGTPRPWPDGLDY